MTTNRQWQEIGSVHHILIVTEAQDSCSVVKSDSKVITDQVEKDSEARKLEMKLYLDAVKDMDKHFKGFTTIHIPKAKMMR